MQIRHSQDNDAAQIAALMTELGYPSSESEIRHRMNEIASSKDYYTLVAVQDDMVVGVIGFVRIVYWEQNGAFIKIQALVVKKEYRQLGVGKQLIKACEEISSNLGVKQITLNCANRAEREAAHLFYQQMGFSSNSTSYSKNSNA